MKGWARIPMMGAKCATSRDGKYDTHLAVKRPECEVDAIGLKLYRSTVLILREGGPYSMGRKINIRGTAYGDFGSLTGNGNEEWETMRANDWFLTLKVGALSHVLVSPVGTFEIPMEINREQEGRADLRIGTPGNHSAINLTKSTSDEIVGGLDSIATSQKRRESAARPLAQRSVSYEEVRWGTRRKTMLHGAIWSKRICEILRM